MPATVVVGTQWGDEGKGKFTDLVAKEGEALAVDDDGVPGVVAALVADDHVHLLGDEVGELPLPFIAPLRSYDHRGGHVTAG